MNFYLIEVIRRKQSGWFPVIVVIGPSLQWLLDMLDGYVTMTDTCEDFRVRAVTPVEIAKLPKHVILTVQQDEV